MILFVVALMVEAAPIIAYYHLKKDPGQKIFPVYHGEHHILIISGTGKVLSASALAYLAGQERLSDRDVLVVNIGVCGTADKSIPKGQLLRVGRVTDHDTHHCWYPDLPLPGACPIVSITCYAGPVIRTEQKGFLPCAPGVVDMESAGFIDMASRWVMANRILLLKIVSDHLDEKNIDKQKLGELIKKQLDSINHLIEQIAKQVTNKRLQDAAESKGDQSWCERVGEQLRLSYTMRQQLKQAVWQARASGKDPLPVLIKACNQDVQHKAEGKCILEHIKQQLRS
jgi:nucleoside phosphorylase